MLLSMDTAPRSKPPRRWSKQSRIFIVSAMVASALVLVIGLVGFARCADWVMHAARAAGDFDPIAPERAPAAASAIAPQRQAMNVTGAPRAQTNPVESRPSPSPSNPPAAAAASATTMSAATAPAVGDQALASAGAAESSAASEGTEEAASGGGGAAGATAGLAATGGTGGAAPTWWDNVVQSALTFIGQTTVSMCGRNTCNTGQVCCNASCGTCVAPGATCDQRRCSDGPRTPTAVLCGSAQCNDGQVCCNPSCGICAAPGESCSERQCR